MATCCIHTEANHRNCTPAPVQSARHVTGPYQGETPPPLPPFCSTLMKQKTLDRKNAVSTRLGAANKELTCPLFSRLSKTKHLQRAHRVCIAKPQPRTEFSRAHQLWFRSKGLKPAFIMLRLRHG